MTLGETLEEGDPSGASGRVSKGRHLAGFLFRHAQIHFLLVQTLSKASETYGFAAQIHSPSRQTRKPAKHVILPATCILVYDNPPRHPHLHRIIEI